MNAAPTQTKIQTETTPTILGMAYEKQYSKQSIDTGIKETANKTGFTDTQNKQSVAYANEQKSGKSHSAQLQETENRNKTQIITESIQK